MNNSGNVKFVAALLCGMVVANANALSVTKVSQVTRPSGYSFTYGAEQISGITYAGGNLFYAIDDTDNKLYPIRLNINRSTGSLTQADITIEAGVVMSGGNDMEGCAFDPCSGKVWVSQETSALIREYDPSTGTQARSAPVPAIQKNYNGNYSLEALTISGDGTTMWTANEEALKVDGPLATNSVGSIVRLTRFTRNSVFDNWTANGEWAYETQPIGTAKDSHTRSGVSGLCALPDGTLLVLERRCYQGGLFPDFNIKIYQVNFSGATDVSSFSSLKNATYTKTTKTQLWTFTDTSDMPNYEGICLGPSLDSDPNSCVIVLITDGGSSAAPEVMTLKLSGLNIRTFEFEKPEGYEGASSIVGQPYRFVNGDTINVKFQPDGVQTMPTPYTNNNAICATVSWTVTGGQNPSSGSGAEASFQVAADGVFSWTASNFFAQTPIVGGDTFEEYDAGTQGSEISGWSGADIEDSIVVATNYIARAGYPMDLANHEKVLSIDGEVTRSYGDNVTNLNQTLDLMITVRRSGDALKDASDCQTAIAADTNGCLNVYTPNGWVKLDNTQYNNGDWVRITVKLDYIYHEARVYVDKTYCGVYEMIDKTKYGVSSLSISGTCNVDDVYLRVDDFVKPDGTTITISDASETNGMHITASPDSAAQAMLSADPAKMAQFSGLFKPVLGSDGKTVTFELTDEATNNEKTNVLANAMSTVDLSSVASGTDEDATVATTPGLYYSLKAGSRLSGMKVRQCELGDGTAQTFTFKKQEDDSGFYTIEVTLEPQTVETEE